MRCVELVPLNDEQCEAFIIEDLDDYAAQLSGFVPGLTLGVLPGRGTRSVSRAVTVLSP